MLFHSQFFLLVFLPLCVGGYYVVARSRAGRGWWLIAASLLFYGYWDLRLLPLLVGSVCVNWLFARFLGLSRRKTTLLAGVALNLAVLGLFKYADFFGGSLTALTGATYRPWGIVLPLGISFFTFQQISYLVDLRKGTAPVYGFRDYALYVSFFPQLIAGPIVRHGELIFQFEADPRRAGLDERVLRGLGLLAIGLGKKLFIADGLARIATPLFDGAADGRLLTFAEGWVAAAAYTFQLYFDFSGYSDMAIGLALMFGFVLPFNFNAPYKSASIREFWRRWHMTLSRFLRDYLYIALGGNRRGRGLQMAFLMATMLLGGLWHGAGWTFVAWGGLHGLGLMVNHVWSRAGLRMPALSGWVLTFLFVMVGWVLFRAESFAVS
ncbi:MAG: MBOAT family O-acyltransferase, partial [Alphaproteobacteria bacterium]